MESQKELVLMFCEGTLTVPLLLANPLNQQDTRWDCLPLPYC